MRSLLLALFTTAMLWGCSFESFVPDDVEEVVRENERLVMAGDAAGLRAAMIPEAAATVTDEVMAQIATIFPAGEAPKETRWLGYMSTSSASTTTGSTKLTEVVRQLDFEGSSVVVSQRLTLTDDGLRLLHVNFTLLTPEEVAAGEFSLEGKSLTHYVVLAGVAAVLLFSIVSVFAVWRPPALKRRILWTLFCLIGVGTLHFNWATGELTSGLIERTADTFRINFLQVHVLSAAAEKVGAGPWIITLAFPLGAVLFWIQKARRRLRLKADVKTAEAPS
jgi:hypothetical protein